MGLCLRLCLDTRPSLSLSSLAFCYFLLCFCSISVSLSSLYLALSLSSLFSFCSPFSSSWFSLSLSLSIVFCPLLSVSAPTEVVAELKVEVMPAEVVDGGGVLHVGVPAAQLENTIIEGPEWRKEPFSPPYFR